MESAQVNDFREVYELQAERGALNAMQNEEVYGSFYLLKGDISCRVEPVNINMDSLFNIKIRFVCLSVLRRVHIGKSTFNILETP